MPDLEYPINLSGSLFRDHKYEAICREIDAKNAQRHESHLAGSNAKLRKKMKKLRRKLKRAKA